MSIGPMGGIGASAAGAPLSQTKGSEAERAAQDNTSQQRVTAADKNAESAAGIGETSEDQESSDRDADGRRLWEQNEQAAAEEDNAQEDADKEASDDEAAAPRQVKDIHGESGNAVDLTG